MEAYKTLLVAFSTESDAAPLVQMGSSLVRESKGKLVGLFTLSPIVSYGGPETIAVVEVIQAQLDDWRERSIAAQAAFRQACEAQGLTHEWRFIDPSDVGASARPGVIARTADLILTAHTPGETALAASYHDAADLVVLSARPVLILPRGSEMKPIGRRILVAWDGGREATRATFEALPLLATAEAVRLVSVHGLLHEPIRQFTPADDLAATLTRHGVPAEVLSIRSDKPTVVDELAPQVLEFGADLVVMGCYGHSRFREFLFGGATQGMLQRLPVPLLMAS